MEVVQIWRAHGDGGALGIGPVIAYCSTKDQASHAAYRQGWYDQNGHVSSISALKIDGKYWALAHSEPIDMDQEAKKSDDKLRMETMASLSPEQLRVLGLSLPRE